MLFSLNHGIHRLLVVLLFQVFVLSGKHIIGKGVNILAIYLRKQYTLFYWSSGTQESIIDLKKYINFETRTKALKLFV